VEGLDPVRIEEAGLNALQTPQQQVSADNAAALAVYREFGFSTCYDDHYRARSGQCH